MPGRPQENASSARPRLVSRLAWFVALWCGGVASVGLLALAIKWMLR